MTWHNVGRLIAIVDLHLKARGTWCSINRRRIILNTIESQSFIKRVITTDIKTDENASGALDQDRTDVVLSVISKAHDVLHLGGPSLIQRPQLKRKNLH